MKLSDFFRRLSFGEFSNISLGSEGDGTIEDGKENKLVHYVNEGLLRLYGRFILKENELTLEQQEGQTFYKLSSRYALSYLDENPGAEGPFYIQDEENANFLDDVVKVLAVYDDRGRKLGLNDGEDEYSVFTPQPEVIQVSHPEQGKPLAVVYQARHPNIPEDDPDAEVELPAVLEPALARYVAYLTFSHMNGVEHAAKANEHLNMFTQICNEVEGMDLVSSSSATTNTRFQKNGWC